MSDADAPIDTTGPQDEAPPPTGVRRTPWRTAGLALVALVLVALVVAAVLLWSDRADLSDRLDEQSDARSVAGQVGEALLTYEAGNLAESRDTIVALSTEEFAAVYEEAFSAGLQPTIEELQASSVGTVRDTYLTEIDDDSAQAIVVVDAEAVSSAGTRRLVGSYLQIELVREDGTWLADQVFAIAAVDESLTEPEGEGEAPTTTAAPSG